MPKINGNVQTEASQPPQPIVIVNGNGNVNANVNANVDANVGQVPFQQNNVHVDNNVKIVYGDDQKQPQQQPHVAPVIILCPTWQCSVCTFVQKNPNATACEMCQTPKIVCPV